MDCLLCNKVQFDDHYPPLDQKISTTLCQLLDIRPATFTSIVNSSTAAICPACSKRLVEIHGLLHQLKVIQVKVDTLRKEIINDLVKGGSSGSTEGVHEEWNKIIQEFRSKVYEKPKDDENGSMSKVTTENLDGDISIQKFFESPFFNNFDGPDPDLDQDLAFTPSSMTTKKAQIILERIQLPPPPESMDFDDVTKNSYNITQEPIASFIVRDRVKFNLKKPSYKSPEIKRGRGRPRKKVGRPRRRKIVHTRDKKILNRSRKILKQISDGKIKKYSNNCNKETKILCSVCGLVLPRISALIEHQRIHTGELPFKCEICGKGHRSKRLLRFHKISHGIGPASVQCSICSIYVSKWTIQAHIDRHKGVKNHLCDFCAMEFTTFYCLQKHRARHLNLNPTYNCTHCDKVYKNKDNLKDHILTHHEKKFDVSCPECKKTFINNKRMHNHRRTVHFKELITPKEYPCTFCGKPFKKMTNLKNHVMIYHTKDKNLPFKCTFDGCSSRGFINKYKLTRHMLIHSGKMDHICQYCGKGYAVKCSLDTHIKHYCKNKP